MAAADKDKAMVSAHRLLPDSIEADDLIFRKFINENSFVEEVDSLYSALKRGVITGQIYADSRDSITSIAIIYDKVGKVEMPYVRLVSSDTDQLLQLFLAIPTIDLSSFKIIVHGECHIMKCVIDYFTGQQSSSQCRYITYFGYKLDEQLFACSNQKLPEGYVIKKFEENDFELIASKWILKGREEWFKKLSESLESVAVYKDNQIAAWVFKSVTGDVHHLYTLPEHRGKGLATFIVQELCNRILHKDRKPYCFIETGNEQSMKLFTRIGFQKSKLDTFQFFAINRDMQ